MSAHAHHSVWELLPWYVNASLEDGELRAVAEHVSRCEECRREIGYLRGLSQTLVGTEANTLSPETALGEMMSKIQKDERRPSSWPRRHTVAPWVLGRLKGHLRRSPVGVRWLVAVQASALVVLLGLLWWPDGQVSVPDSPFRTLSDPLPTTAQATTQRLRMVFASGVDEQAMRDLLLEVEAEIVAGPTPFGVYTLGLKNPRGKEELAHELDELRARPEVAFAELLP